MDTNLLLLFFVGAVNAGYVPKFKRTRKYSEQDYANLCRFLNGFDYIVTTPNILTEVSNLGGHLRGDYRWQFFNHIAMSAQVMQEKYRNSMECAASPMCNNFGLADTVAFSVAGNRHLLLTDDSALAKYAGARGVDVVHFKNV
ncbi:MAG: PIN domain-containing protein [Gammaproteobacteria bacterium]|nr:PIN domain-containing protein [Gammaproteobacteria bacterium]MDD9799208.1 PIN domain-containing protein [Gammaproteobacteria bacterium]MDD9871003.1 PIN domain-containing protein [Gammaproteobacteria bacterium]